MLEYIALKNNVCLSNYMKSWHQQFDGMTLEVSQDLRIIHSYDIFNKPEMNLFNKTSPELFVHSFSGVSVMTGWYCIINFSFFSFSLMPFFQQPWLWKCFSYSLSPLGFQKVPRHESKRVLVLVAHIYFSQFSVNFTFSLFLFWSNIITFNFKYAVI